MVPFAPVTEKGMFDYATGKWAPAKFKNYVTGEWITGVPSTDVTIQVGTRDPALGRSYAQIARQGWGMQKSQNGGANPAFSGPASTSYHLWAVAPQAASKPGAITTNNDLFHNSKVDVDASLPGLTRLSGPNPRQEIRDGLRQIGISFKQFEAERPGLAGVAAAHKLAPLYRQTLDLRAKVAASELNPQAKASLLFELDAKIEQFQTTLKDLLGLDLIAFTTHATKIENSGFRGGGPDETPRSVSPGEEFNVRIHTSSTSPDAHVLKTWFQSQTSEG
jgi:hypothetical protein